jgi:hypothetical protein
MSKTRKFSIVFICVLAVSFFFGNFNSVSALSMINYNGIEINDEEYATLLNLGFSVNEIYYMNLETFNANKDLDATLMSQTTKYFKRVEMAFGNSYDEEVTEEEFYNHNNNDLLRGQQITQYYTVTTTITAVNTYYRYKISVVWNSPPSVSKYDIIGIGFDDDVKVRNNIVYFGYYYVSGGTTYTESYYYDRQITAYGSSTVFKYPDNTSGFGVSMYYDVVKDTTNTITNLAMCGDYAHATSNSVTGSIAMNHTIGFAGIGLNASNINYFTAIPCTYATKSVNW